MGTVKLPRKCNVCIYSDAFLLFIIHIYAKQNNDIFKGQEYVNKNYVQINQYLRKKIKGITTREKKEI